MSAADVIGFLGFSLHAANKLYNAVQNVKKAPEEMQALQTEVKRLRGFLAQIVEMGGSHNNGEDRLQDVLKLRLDLIEQIRQLIEVANCFIEKATKPKEKGTRKVIRALWPFHASEARRLSEEFRALYLTVSAVHSTDLLAKILAMESNVLVINDRTVAALEEQVTRAIDHRIAPAVERLLDERIGRILTRSLTKLQREGRRQTFDELCSIRSDAEVVRGHSTTRISLSDREIDTPVPLDRVPGPSRIIGAQPTGGPPHGTRAPPTIQRLRSLYSASGPQRQHCPAHCRCRCHTQSSNFRLIPQMFRPWFGDIRIHEAMVTSLISRTRWCDDHECVQTRESLSLVKWYLPSWFGQIHAEVAFQSFPLHFVIQTPRLVASLDILDDISLEALKVKLWTRELTVNDVNAEGLSVLHIMAFLFVVGCDEAHEMMCYLIEAGAPLDWEYVGLTVTEYVKSMHRYWLQDTSAASQSLASFNNTIAKPFLREDVEDAWESIRTKRNWSDLHYLVAHPPSCRMQLQSDLASILRRPSAPLDVNTKDPHGQLPLWQAIRSCPEAVDGLLRLGANPHLVDDPIALAIQAESRSIAVGPLVRAGAYRSEKHRGRHGKISAYLHDIVRCWSCDEPDGNAPAALELVRHAGHRLNWDVTVEHGFTLLDWATWLVNRYPYDEQAVFVYKLYRARNVSMHAQLISGSCLGRLDSDAHLRSRSLIKVGLAGNIEAVKHLIASGAMVNERDEAGRTLLHLVAMDVVPNGYIVAVEVVRNGGYGVDWDALTVDGESAEQLAKETLEYLTPSETKGRYDEVMNILHLLQYRALPDDIDYVYPCMHSDYCRKCSMRPCTGYCSDGLRMPGGFP